MNRWRGYARGVLSGLMLAGALGLARLAMEPSAAAGAAAPTPSAAVAVAAATQATPDDGKLRIIEFGAHPDDCEILAGGAAILWAGQGHHVKFVSVTNGRLGQWGSAGGPLAQRRAAKVQEAARILGITTEVLDIHDGEGDGTPTSPGSAATNSSKDDHAGFAHRLPLTAVGTLITDRGFGDEDRRALQEQGINVIAA